MKETTIQSVVTPTVSIVVNGEDAAGNPTKKAWKLCLDYRALAKIEDETGLDLKLPKTWDGLSSGKMFPKIIWCCLTRYSPEVTLEEVIDNLNPAAHQYLRATLLELTFPGFLEEASKQVKADEHKAGVRPNGKPEGQKTA